jgi:hypothetical protein
MGFFRGPKSTKVTSSMISSIVTTGGTITAQGNTGRNGAFSVTFRHDVSGCGGADSGILVLLRDDISWTKIGFDWEGNGTAACWSFMNTTGGNFGGATGTSDGNMIQYGTGAGDTIINPYLTWEVPEFQSHNRVYACNNDANNFFNHNSGEYKKFRMVRTRNTSGNLAGIHHGRSCNATGVYTIIKNIYIW